MTNKFTTGHLQKTAIIDKNGKATHVHKSSGVTSAAGFRAPSKPTIAAEPEIAMADSLDAIISEGYDEPVAGEEVQPEAAPERNFDAYAASYDIDRSKVFSPANSYTPDFGDSAWGGGDQFGYWEDGYTREASPAFWDTDRLGYNRLGFHLNGTHRDTGTAYNPDGRDSNGFDRKGAGFDGTNSLLRNLGNREPAPVAHDRVRLRDGELKERARSSKARGASIMTDTDYEFLSGRMNEVFGRRGYDYMTPELHKALMAEVTNFAVKSYGKQVVKPKGSNW